VGAAEAGAQEGEEPPTLAIAKGAYEFLKGHSSVTDAQLASMGFSFGAYYALWLDETYPDAFDRVILFYGMAGADVSQSKAKYLAHFAENDPYESTDAARDMNAANLRAYIYPDTGHWFFEDNRPDAYNVEAAKLAWERSVEFLKH
jgi:carboxymethylenebutenolidase